MNLPAYNPNPIQRLIQKAAALRPISAILAPTLYRLDPQVLRLSGNRFTLSSLLSGLPVVWLTMTGRRSGEKRTLPLFGIPDGELVALVASNFGKPHHPGWYHNLVAEPHAQLTINGETYPCLARECDPQEYDRLWAKAMRAYLGYEAYRRRAGERPIPIMILAPE